MSCNSPTRSTFFYYFDENTFLTALTSITFAVIGIFIYIFSAYSYLEKQRIPTAIQPSAPFGHIKDVIFHHTSLYECFWNYYNKCKKKRYLFGGMYLFFQPAVLLVHPIVQKEIFADFVDVNKIHQDFVALFNDDIFNNIWVEFNGIKKNVLKNIEQNTDITVIVHDCLMEITNVLFGVPMKKELLQDLTKDETYSSFQRYIGIAYPFFKRNKSLKVLKELMDNNIQYRKKNDVKKPDVLGNYINLRNVDDEEKLISELFHSIMQNIVFSVSTVLFCLYELSFNCKIQNELLEEIARFNKSNWKVSIKDIERLSYLEAVIKETLRKYPPVPYMLKKCNKDYVNANCGLNIPKNTYVAGSIFGMHYDASNYPNPECFDPDRFLTETSSDTIYFPFGFDSTNKLGHNITSTTVTMVLLILLSHYKVILTNNNSSMEFDNSKMNVHPRGPLPIKLEPIK